MSQDRARSGAVGRAAAGVALAVGVALALPGSAAAAPDAAAGSPLAAAIDTMAAQGGDAGALNAARAIVDAGRVDTASVGDLFAGYQMVVSGLQRLGIKPFFYPTAAPGCVPGSPFGLAPAVAGAVPGPWPRLTIPGVDPVAVKSGQVVFAFVPLGLQPDGPDTSGMQVAWFNISTLRGGFAQMGSLAQLIASAIPAEVPVLLRPMAEQIFANFFAEVMPLGGVRAAPVDTGAGTVLAAVFGTVRSGDKTCFFLPTIGLTNVS